MELSYTLVTDGPTDRALLPILDWLFLANGYPGTVQREWCDCRLLRSASRAGLSDKISYAIKLYPCDVLFIHRDSEGLSRQRRLREITDALNIAFARVPRIPVVCVIPVRMTEAWLLFDEAAIRRAAGNPNGRIALDLPRLCDLEDMSAPKDVLRKLVIRATGLGLRRQRTFRVGHSITQISQHVHDFSPLRQLAAFAQLESDVRAAIQAQAACFIAPD